MITNFLKLVLLNNNKILINIFSSVSVKISFGICLPNQVTFNCLSVLSVLIV